MEFFQFCLRAWRPYLSDWGEHQSVNSEAMMMKRPFEFMTMSFHKKINRLYSSSLYRQNMKGMNVGDKVPVTFIKGKRKSTNISEDCLDLSIPDAPVVAIQADSAYPEWVFQLTEKVWHSSDVRMI